MVGLWFLIVQGWMWWECAGECAQRTDCAYWMVTKRTKACSLRKRRGTTLQVNLSNKYYV